jgi:hypothetical protein
MLKEVVVVLKGERVGERGKVVVKPCQVGTRGEGVLLKGSVQQRANGRRRLKAEGAVQVTAKPWDRSG